MRAIDGDAIVEILTTAIRNMQGVAKFIGAEDDPEIKMEIKAYTDILNGVKDMPTIEPEPLIRCGQCKYAEVADQEDSQDGYTCQFHRGSIWFSGSYCSWAARRGDEG